MLTILDPLSIPDWDALVLNTPGTGFFHTSAWCRVLSESYGYKPVYFTEIEGDRFRTLVPMMEIDSFLTGKRGVSLPFTDYCDPIISTETSPPSSEDASKSCLDASPPLRGGDGGEGGAESSILNSEFCILHSAFNSVFTEIIEYGKKAGWRSVELRSRRELSNGVTASANYYGHTLDLSQGEKKLFSNLRDSTRRNIKKAVAEGVTVDQRTDLEAVKEFHRLNCLTRRDHGLPPQPFAFFEKVFSRIIAAGKGFVVLAAHRGKNIAGAMFFHFGEQGIFKYGASDKRHLSLRANNLVMWEAVRWYCDNGFRSFCFGRTEPDNEGLRQFKRGWGTEERRMEYYRYNTREQAFVKGTAMVLNLEHRMFNLMPLPLLRLTGTLLYKHIG